MRGHVAELNALYCFSKANEETSVLPGLVGLWEWSGQRDFGCGCGRDGRRQLHCIC